MSVLYYKAWVGREILLPGTDGVWILKLDGNVLILVLPLVSLTPLENLFNLSEFWNPYQYK